MAERGNESPDNSAEENDAVSSEEDDVQDDFHTALFRYLLQQSVPQSTTNETLVEALERNKSLKTRKVIDAFLLAPRADFLLADMLDDAYSDHPLRFSTMGFNISAPHMYATCLENLKLEEGNSFLDIGSGCGLLTLLGGLLVGQSGFAHGLDIRKDIVEFSESNCKKWKEKHPDKLVNVSFELRNCFLVDPQERTWDRIHVGACCPEFRLNYLYTLLTPGGRLVTPYGDKLLLAIKGNNGTVETTTLAYVRYGDLIIPSEAEEREAIIKLQSLKRQTIRVPEESGKENLKHLLFDEKTADFRFIIEGKILYAHKYVLSDRCSHFQIMFESGMKETSASELEIHDFTFSQMQAVLEVIYTNTCNIDSENAVELLQVADFYKLEWMKCKCEQVLHNNIEIETAAQILALADQFDAKQLRSACFEYMLKNYQTIITTQGFQQLGRHLIIEVMKEACSRCLS